MPVAAHLGNRNLALKQRLHGELAESDDDLGTDEIDLFSEKRLAGGDFIRFGIAIFRRPAFDDVCDVNVVALEPHTFGDDVGQKLAGASDKGLALKIFVAPRPLADKHQLSVADCPRRKPGWSAPSRAYNAGNRRSRRAALRGSSLGAAPSYRQRNHLACPSANCFPRRAAASQPAVCLWPMFESRRARAAANGAATLSSTRQAHRCR